MYKTLALKVLLAAHLPSRSPMDVDDLRTMGGVSFEAPKHTHTQKENKHT